MSSEGSVTSCGSRIRQFGLYRTIDARTEEFLRSSRKRQIRQGCACAAISTAITVTVVVVILLVYEYTIAVEWSLVQMQEGVNRPVGVLNNQPFADRLDRSYFGFDQDYYERMPLLINALQEHNYFDPTLETSGPLTKKRYNITMRKLTTVKPIYKLNTVRRTSPRPFFFEYRGPTPIPFSKTRSKNWIERYRNEERLKNIRQIIKYLEKTINAKVGDMDSKPTSTHIAFTGMYIEPMLENKSFDTATKSARDLQQESSENIQNFNSNHLADPLFNFKPENPGDVNLLADDFLRFAPILTPSLINSSTKYPMFRQIPFSNRNCLGNKCEESKNRSITFLRSSSKVTETEMPPISTTKSFSVMLNLFPIKKDPPTSTKPLDNIYLTTSRPLIKFKRKSNVVLRRVYTPYKRPRYLSNIINKKNKEEKDRWKENKDNNNTQHEIGTQMMVHVKVYSHDDKTGMINETNRVHSRIPSTQTNPYTTKAPIELSTSQIGDYHAGSSGYIPVETKSETPSLTKVTTVIPFFELATEYPWPSPTEVLKFNVEDAKLPNQYKTLEKKEQFEISRRNSRDHSNMHEEPSTLIVKLKNDFTEMSTETLKVNKSAEKVEETTTVWTYVPQINGHHRSINQNSNNVNTWLNANPENERKKRLEESVSGIHTYVPMYKEIKRNHTLTSKNDNDYNINNKDIGDDNGDGDDNDDNVDDNKNDSKDN